MALLCKYQYGTGWKESVKAAEMATSERTRAETRQEPLVKSSAFRAAQKLHSWSVEC